MFAARARDDAEGILEHMDPAFEAVGLDGTRYTEPEHIRAYFTALGDSATESNVDVSGDLFLHSGERVLVVGRLYTIDGAGLRDAPAVWEFELRDGKVVRLTAHGRLADVPGHETFVPQ
ncbi:MAG: nuclear transport factor 2 family protein [Solirubrobacteraceae bacterium]